MQVKHKITDNGEKFLAPAKNLGHKADHLHFRPLPPIDTRRQIAGKVLDKTYQQILDYWQTPKGRTDAGDILIRLLDGEWWYKLDLTETRNGGFQQDANTRIHELRAKLKAHGLFVGCLQDSTGERTISFYRLIWEDEVKFSRTSGRVMPFSLEESRKRSTKAPAPKTEPIAAQSAQSSLWQQLPFLRAMKSSFVDHETGAA